MAVRTISDLQKGESGVIKTINNKTMYLKLLEMGCLPGAQVRMDAVAPFGDPVCINVGGQYLLSLRLSEASAVEIE